MGDIRRLGSSYLQRLSPRNAEGATQQNCIHFFVIKELNGTNAIGTATEVGDAALADAEEHSSCNATVRFIDIPNNLLEAFTEGVTTSRFSTIEEITQNSETTPNFLALSRDPVPSELEAGLRLGEE